MNVARQLPKLAALAALTLAGPIAAQTVTVGTPTSNNCFPFGCPASPFNTSRYQQVFLASEFGASPLDILSLTFFNSFDPTHDEFPDATYSISFSTTTAAVTGLSSNLSANVGTPEMAFATLTLTGGVTGSSFTINGSGYNYDPTMGNLLMDVVVSSATANGSPFGAFEADGSGAVTSRAYINNGVGNADGEGLVTQFAYAPVMATPEPTTLVLMATGMAGLAGWTRRRKKTRD